MDTELWQMSDLQEKRGWGVRVEWTVLKSIVEVCFRRNVSSKIQFSEKQDIYFKYFPLREVHIPRQKKYNVPITLLKCFSNTIFFPIKKYFSSQIESCINT